MSAAPRATATLNGTPDLIEETWEPMRRLNRDLLAAHATLSPREVRYLVDLYYQMQENRKRASNQVRAMDSSEEPHQVIDWVLNNAKTIEGDIKRVLDAWSLSRPLGVWSRSIVGIGPVIASGLLAHIDIERAPTYGHIWRFAGLDPTVVWNKGEKRPWNATLKTLCWKASDSFVKFQNHKDDVYGRVYVARKALEVERSAAGESADDAAKALATRNFRRDTAAKAAYDQGQLPAGQLDARARRYAVKLFLAHYFEAAYCIRYQRMPPVPYPIARLGHAHYIAPPHVDQIDGWEALRAAAGF